jgi:hypothetical protein
MSQEYAEGYRYAVDVDCDRSDGTRTSVTIFFTEAPSYEEIQARIDELPIGVYSQIIHPVEPVVDPNYKTTIDLMGMSMPDLVDHFNKLKPPIKAKANTFKDKASIIPKIQGMRPPVYSSFNDAIRCLLTYHDGRKRGIPYRLVLLCLQAEYPEASITLGRLQEYAKEIGAPNRDF